MKVRKEKAFRITTHANDYTGGDIDAWKAAFYEIWRYQMTFDFAYSIAVRESRASGVFFDLLVKEGQEDDAKDMLERLGCSEIQCYEQPVGIVEGYELPDDIEEVFTE